MHIYFDIIMGSIIGTISYCYFYIKRERKLHPQRALDQKTNLYVLKSAYENILQKNILN